MSQSQYPEHLNPFAEPKSKTSLKISNSFRDFTRSIRKSFRIKKKEPKEDEVEVRHKTEPFRRIPMSYPPNNQDTFTLALPRSRFRERLSKGQTYNPSGESSTRIHDPPGPNPFDESQDQNGGNIKGSMRRRRGKKRAPLPPNKSMSSQDVNEDYYLNIPPHTSHWSLTSGDSEFTYSTDNISERDYNVDIDRVSMTEDFSDFNKEMEKLKDDANNNVINNKENVEGPRGSNNNIPDLVISCPDNGSDSCKLNDSNSKETQALNAPNNLPESSDVDNHKNSSLDSEKTIPKCDEGKVVATVTSHLNEVDIEELPEEIQQLNKENSSEEPFLYHEKKSLYITGSRNELLNDSGGGYSTFTEKVTLYIAGSREELDNRRSSESNDDSTPTPKQRKNKLTKSFLLGTES